MFHELDLLDEELREGGYGDDDDDEEMRREGGRGDQKKDGSVGTKGVYSTGGSNGSSGNNGEASSGIAPSASARGVWNYCIGLVGKPSAGKSTFYNAGRTTVLVTHPFIYYY